MATVRQPSKQQSHHSSYNYMDDVDLSPFIIIIIIFLKPWYFIPRVLKLAKVKVYVLNGHDGYYYYYYYYYYYARI